MAFVNMNPNGWSNLYVNVGTHTGMQPEVVADTLYFLLGDGDGDSSCSAATSPTDFSVYFSFFFKRTHIMYAFLSNNQIKSNQNAVFFSLTLAHSFFFHFVFVSIDASFSLFIFFRSRRIRLKYHKFTKSKSFWLGVYLLFFFLFLSLDLIFHLAVAVCLFIHKNTSTIAQTVSPK